MAKKLQCEQCSEYSKESGLCRKEWKPIEFNEADCPLFECGNTTYPLKESSLPDDTLETNKNRLQDWSNSPESVPYIAREMINHHGGRIYFDTPEVNGFPAIRFKKRMFGYMYALAFDRITTKDKFPVSFEEIRPYVSNEEVVALEMLQKKIEEQSKQNIPSFDDGYVGMLEGMAIYINKEDVSSLYSEIDINLNKNCDDEGIPSYAYHKSLVKAGKQLAKCNKKKNEVVQMLIDDGLAKKGAIMIVDMMIKIIKQQRKNTALKEILIGVFILCVGAFFTGWSYYSAVLNGGGDYLIMIGLFFGGFVMLATGIENFISAIRYKG